MNFRAVFRVVGGYGILRNYSRKVRLLPFDVMLSVEKTVTLPREFSTVRGIDLL